MNTYIENILLNTVCALCATFVLSTVVTLRTSPATALLV